MNRKHLVLVGSGGPIVSAKRITESENVMHISDTALKEVEAALSKYENEVVSSNLTSSTKSTYILHSENFVRWLKGEFTPGSTKG